MSDAILPLLFLVKYIFSETSAELKHRQKHHYRILTQLAVEDDSAWAEVQNHWKSQRAQKDRKTLAGSVMQVRDLFSQTVSLFVFV